MLKKMHLANASFLHLLTIMLCRRGPVVHGLWPKKLSVSVAVPPAPVRVPSQKPLAPSAVSVMSVTNDKDNNEMILAAVHRSPGICLTGEENPGKFHLGDRR